MTGDRQTADVVRQPSAWMRWLAICSLLLLLVSSAAGATHIHDGLLGASLHAGVDKAAVSGTLDTDAACPLCASFHSILPAQSQSSFAWPLILAEAVPSRLSRSVPTALHFALITRPPPASA